ncbi:hypothetical protein [Paenibacillus methanolicus]|uniref:Uncharacterized protein n=1 Tax=Paenibacillus methanolicus TaxID=582686 RepID=A0A5S5C272_9BACL|nr:hypothetical protein [Paenibacillus methanolicus]TYP73259.1 hypothetical protein BCM02_107243 [Paenibacillus methanolicus]
MGKQIRFFMNADDEMAFCNKVYSLGGVLVTRDLVEIRNGFLIENEPRKVYLRFPYSRIMLEDSGQLDVIQSDVIELVRCISRANALTYGRLWLPVKNDSPSEPSLIDAYYQLVRWMKTSCKLNTDKDCYIARGAYRQYKYGVEMMASPNTACRFE